MELVERFVYLDETETKVLQQQVKRNIDRFPQDFMYQLTKEEKAQLVLRSKKAIKINTEVFLTFTHA